MRRRSLLGMSASLLIAACAHQATEAPPAMAWSLQQNPSEGLKLTYGQAHSDNLLVMMSCQPASGQVELAVAAREPGAAVRLASAGDQVELAGEAWATPMEGVMLVSDVAPAQAPVLARFSRSGQLTVEADGRAVRTVARGDDRALVAEFVSLCGREV